MIDYEDFEQMDIRIGTILSVEAVEGSNKLLKLSVDLGEEESRQIVSGIAKYFIDPQSLVNRQVPVLTNLKPREIMGLISEGMILAASGGGAFSLLSPEEEVPPGSLVH